MKMTIVALVLLCANVAEAKMRRCTYDGRHESKNRACKILNEMRAVDVDIMHVWICPEGRWLGFDKRNPGKGSMCCTSKWSCVPTDWTDYGQRVSECRETWPNSICE